MDAGRRSPRSGWGHERGSRSPSGRRGSSSHHRRRRSRSPSSSRSRSIDRERGGRKGHSRRSRRSPRRSRSASSRRSRSGGSRGRRRSPSSSVSRGRRSHSRSSSRHSSSRQRRSSRRSASRSRSPRRRRRSPRRRSRSPRRRSRSSRRGSRSPRRRSRSSVHRSRSPARRKRWSSRSRSRSRSPPAPAAGAPMDAPGPARPPSRPKLLPPGGRGAGRTLPAWMTRGTGGVPGASSVAEPDRPSYAAPPVSGRPGGGSVPPGAGRDSRGGDVGALGHGTSPARTGGSRDRTVDGRSSRRARGGAAGVAALVAGGEDESMYEYGAVGGLKGNAAADGDGEEEAGPARKADFGLSGALAKDTTTGNTYKGVVLKWSEPPEARIPQTKWRLYIFKKGELLEKPLHLHRQSAYLFGRDETIADVLLEHPSCSKQHAVLQFRLVEVPPRPDKPLETRRVVKPYVMDLESTNGTRLNGKALEAARYVELRASDMLQFGHSSREYVLVNASDPAVNTASI